MLKNKRRDTVKNISQIDRNFAIQTSLNQKNMKFYDIADKSFDIYGVFYENGVYRRIPKKIAEAVSEGVFNLHTNTAGGRVRFVTDSEYVAVKSYMIDIGKMPHFALTGSAGFDLYVGEKEEYFGSFVPPFDMTDGYESVIHFGSRKAREITVNFPLYSSVEKLFIGLEESAELKKSSGYKHKKPIVFYGSSITQGGCASRPGNSYQSIISRELKSDFVNLGFSGNAKAEDEMAHYISSLDMSVFVYDYDHNAPTPEHLKNTHQKMFLTIREKNPDLPILILSRPKYKLTEEEKQRLEIIRKTFDDARDSGDKNVYFICGTELMEYAGNDGTVDGCHPNDLGFCSMAKALIPVLKSVL